MKKIIFLLAILIALSKLGYAQITYVYDYNNQVFIEQVPNQFMTKFNLNEDMIPVITPNDSFILKRVHNGGFVLKGNRNQLFELFHEYLNCIQPVYTFNADGVGDTLLFSSEVLLKPIEGIDTNILDNLISSLNITNVEKNEVFWTLHLTLEMNVVDVANFIQEQGLTEFSYPNTYMLLEQASIPSDPYFEKQFYLRNTGQSINGTSGTQGADIKIIDAWNITKGDPNIKIAVCDEGVTSDHPDLPNSRQIRLNGSNIAKGWWEEPNTKNAKGEPIIDRMLPTWSDPNDPAPNLFLNNNHGNACA